MRGGGGEAEGASWGGRAGEAAVRGTDGRGGAGGQRAGRLEVARAGVPASARLACVCESAAPPARVRVRVGMGEDEQGRGNLVNWLSLLFFIFFSLLFS